MDAFLVISGFLLFRGLLTPGAEQKFHYGSYLLKKAWRIIPLWFVVTLLVCLLTAVLMAPSRAGDILKTARYSALFQADYYIDRSEDYFNVFSKQNPFLHYWYLSITQQLYIIAPLLVIPLVRWCSRRAALILLGVLSLLSLAYYIPTSSPTLAPESVREHLLHALGTKTAYYHLIPRFWEIVAGFDVFLLPEFSSRPRLRSLLALLALAGLIASFYLYNTGSPAVYLSVFTALLAMRYASTGLAARLLCSKPMQAIGTISFSLYLWHWPIMVFWKYLCFDNLSVWQEVLVFIVCLLVAALSWRFIEGIRTPGRKDWKGTLQRCALLLLLPFMLLFATQANKYIKNHSKGAYVITHAVLKEVTDAETVRGLEALGHEGLGTLYRLGAEDARPAFLLLGDSHAEHLQAELDAACRREGVAGLSFNASLLPFWNVIQGPVGHESSRWNEALAAGMLHYLDQHPEIHYVVIGLYWEHRFRNLPCKDWRDGRAIYTESERMELTSNGFAEFCDRVRAQGKTVIALGDNPTFEHPYPLDEWARYQQLPLLQHIRPYRERIITPEQHEQKQAFSRGLLRRLEQEGRIRHIDLSEAMKVDGVYPARVDGEFLYRDNDHLTTAGSRRVVVYLIPRLLEILNEGKAETLPPDDEAAVSPEH